jgi:hypothetical protein
VAVSGREARQTGVGVAFGSRDSDSGLVADRIRHHNDYCRGAGVGVEVFEAWA